MTVKDIIEILSTYEPETEVKMTSGPFISEIVDVRLVTDIDTNKTYMCIYGDKDIFTKYENMGLLQWENTRLTIIYIFVHIEFIFMWYNAIKIKKLSA